MITIQEHATNSMTRAEKRAARKRLANKQPVKTATVYVARCNRMPAATPSVVADKFRSRFERKLLDTIETARLKIADFQTKLSADAFNAFDWTGKSALEAAGKHRAAIEVHNLLNALDEKDDGYAGYDSVTSIQRVQNWLVHEVMQKVRYLSNPEPKDLCRLAALAELQDEFAYYTFEQQFAAEGPNSCVAQDYE